MTDTARKRGILIVALAGVFWSLQGATIRMVEEASGAQIIFWRASSQLTTLLILVTIINRGRVITAFRRAGFVGVIGGLCALVAGSSFVFALLHTTVANVVFILASAPIFAGILAWIVMRERIARRSIVAMAIALCGIGLMVSEGLVSGNPTGHLLALVTTIAFAGITVVARWGGGLDMLPSACWGALFTLIFAALLAGGDVMIKPTDLAASAFSGGVLTACGAICFFFGARYVPAAVLAFLSLTEVVLSPLWVWIGFNEVPTTITLVGGTIVLSAIASEAWVRMTHSRSESIGHDSD